MKLPILSNTNNIQTCIMNAGVQREAVLLFESTSQSNHRRFTLTLPWFRASSYLLRKDTTWLND